MRFVFRILGWTTLVSCCLANYFPDKSSKRGLVYVSTADDSVDDKIWVREGSDLTWYYNYEQAPNAAYANYTSFEFVPMLWGAPSDLDDTTFLENVTAQIVAGRNITYAMGFNEPDGTSDTGGSDVSPSDGAKVWIKNLEPLRKLGITLGAPAVTGGSSGFDWLANFTEACDGNCTFEFIPVHWYGSFDGMTSHIGEVMEKYPGKMIWVTEFALNNATLNETQEFFEEACEYFDKDANITHYSYFGSFRSCVSNVGANVAMLTGNGTLTDIGSWYLGGNDTGAVPGTVCAATPTTATSTSTSTYTVPALATKRGAGSTLSSPGLLLVIGIVTLVMTVLA